MKEEDNFVPNSTFMLYDLEKKKIEIDETKRELGQIYSVDKCLVWYSVDKALVC